MIERTKNVEMKLSELEKATAQYVTIGFAVFALVQRFGKPILQWSCSWDAKRFHILPTCLANLTDAFPPSSNCSMDGSETVRHKTSFFSRPSLACSLHYVAAVARRPAHCPGCI